MLPQMPECIKVLCLNYIHNDCQDDESLFFPFVRMLLAGLGCEALAIRVGTIQWCFYYKQYVVNDYLSRIETDEDSHIILAQIYFYGLSSDKKREECKQRLEKILNLNNVKVVAKVVEIALKSYGQAEMQDHSRYYLERYSSDDREEVMNAYCRFCEFLPVEAFRFYCGIAKMWAGNKHREIHSQLEVFFADRLPE